MLQLWKIAYHTISVPSLLAEPYMRSDKAQPPKLTKASLMPLTVGNLPTGSKEHQAYCEGGAKAKRGTN